MLVALVLVHGEPPVYISQYLHVSNHRCVHLKLAQCYLSIIYIRTNWGGGGGREAMMVG